jgi:hypothetical protein
MQFVICSHYYLIALKRRRKVSSIIISIMIVCLMLAFIAQHEAEKKSKPKQSKPIKKSKKV